MQYRQLCCCAAGKLATITSQTSLGPATSTDPSPQMVENGTAPDLMLATETPLQFGYVLLVVCGAQHIRFDHATPRLDHARTLRYLLSLGVPHDVQDIVGYTALTHTCMFSPRPDLARILLEHGADPNHQDKYGSVPLMGACRMKALENVNVLMEYGARLDIKNADGNSPEELYLNAGPEVTAVIQRWKRKRAGETMAMEDGKRCAFCGRSDAKLKTCARCHVARYCSPECQGIPFYTKWTNEPND